MKRMFAVGFMILFTGLSLQAMGEKVESLTLSNVLATGITENQIIIKFNTNLAVASQVRYGLNYDFINNQKLTSSALNLEPATEHSVVLSGLKAKTTYRYQVLLRDPKTNEAVYSDFLTATTL